MRITYLCIAAVLAGCTYTPPAGTSYSGQLSAEICTSNVAVPLGAVAACETVLNESPDRDLLTAGILTAYGIANDIRAGRFVVPAGSAPTSPIIMAEFERRGHWLVVELANRRMARMTAYRTTGSADCGAWHWNNVKLACLP